MPLEDQTPTISNWDAYTPEGLIEAFEQETGVLVLSISLVLLALRLTRREVRRAVER